MSIFKNVFSLKKVYELANSNCWVTYDNTNDAGELYGWGCNQEGNIGDGTKTSSSSPVQIPGTTWLRLSSAYHTLGVRADCKLFAWGNNGCFALGLGNNTSRCSPVEVGGLWRDVSVGRIFSLGLKHDGTLWSWGTGTCGVLGLGDVTTRSSPVQIPGTDWNRVSASEHAMALKTDGSLYTWGPNAFGQLGVGNGVDRCSPTLVPGCWCKISAGTNHSTALRNDGSLYVWGNGTVCGGLGYNCNYYNSTCHRCSPIQIAGCYIEISAGNLYTAAIDFTCSGWIWGNNNAGQLGLGDTVCQFCCRVPGGSVWKCLTAGGVFGGSTFGVRLDNSLYAWGCNTWGQLGVGDTTNRCVPTQIPGLWGSPPVGAEATHFARKPT